jgi:MFS family permease
VNVRSFFRFSGYFWHCKQGLDKAFALRLCEFMSSNASDLIPIESERKAGALTFGLLFLLESLVRSFNSGVLSIQAYDLMGSSQKVSELATVVSLTVLCVTLMMPALFGRFRRRWAYTIGGALLICGSLALASFTVTGQYSGMVLRNSGASIMNVTLQLYILDHIRKSELTTSEPLRLAISTFAWVVGPASGVWLYTHYGSIAPQMAAIAAALLVLSVFWYLRLHDKVNMPPGNLQNFNPLKNTARFVAQPRLRLAWAIAFGRSCFWATFFTYGPLLMIEGGLGKQAGGLIVSFSQLFLLSAFGFGALAKRIGVRGVITLCFVMISVATVLAGLLGLHSPNASAALLLVAALFASGIDSVGGIPFLRAVRPLERQQMTAVYRTFIEFSELIPSLIFVVALKYFDVSIVFIILGGSLTSLGFLVWRYLPKSM